MSEEKPKWYVMDSLFDVKSKQFITTEKGETGYLRGQIGEHYIFRVDIDGMKSDDIEHIYGNVLAAAEYMGIDKEKVVIFPSCVDICRLVPCEEKEAAELELQVEVQRHKARIAEAKGSRRLH